MKPIMLDTTTKKLQMVMSAAATTTNPSYVVSYADVTTAFTEGNLNGELNGTTAVDIVPAPAASARRTVTEIVLHNADTAAVTVTLRLDDNGTVRIIRAIPLAAGESWEMSTQAALDGADGKDAEQIVIILTDVKSSGVQGGSSVAGVQTRTLNTMLPATNDYCSLASNQFTLAVGTWEVVAEVPAYRANNHKIGLYDVTNATRVKCGMSSYSGSTSTVQSTSTLKHIFTLTAETTFSIRHYAQAAQGTNGLGVATSISGVDEEYTQVVLRKLA
jgi:hypothetical protein